MLKNIKAVFFDADDTIMNHKESEKQALKHLSNSIGKEFKNEYQDIFRPLDWKLWDDAINKKSIVPIEKIPEYRFEVLFNKINLEYYDYKKANELFKEGFAKTSALNEGAYDIIKYLYDKGYQIYIITNGIVELQKPRIINSKIANYISDIIVSEEVGISKPDAKIFNVLLDKINIKSSEVIMVGDSLEKDIKGAKNANIKSVWYNPCNKENKTNILPDYQIKELIKIKELL